MKEFFSWKLLICLIFVSKGIFAQADVNHPVYQKEHSFNDIVVNEIMFTQINKEPEWIEIYNRQSDSINLRKWKVSDGTTTAVLSLVDLFIQPRSFLVLVKDSTLSAFYPYSFPLHIVAEFPSLNNTGDNVIITDSLGFTIDSLRYTPQQGGANGHSLERLFVDSSSLTNTNWKQSVSANRATPGKQNSVTPKQFNLQAVSLSCSQKYNLAGDTLRLALKIKNIGTQTASGARVLVYNDADLDTIPRTTELLFSQQCADIAAADSAAVQLQCGVLSNQFSRYIAVIVFANDEDTSNNRLDYTITPMVLNEHRGDIVINEIMYAPINKEPEWIELYNRKTNTVNLREWKVTDSKDTAALSTGDLLIQPCSFLVLSKDTAVSSFYPYSFPLHIVAKFPSLNNTGDNVIITDSLGFVIDSLRYTPQQGGANGHSLERVLVDSFSLTNTNWKQSVSTYHATPGKVNSQSNLQGTGQRGLSFNPNPFSPDGDGFEDFMTITIGAGFNLANISITIFDQKGRQVRKLLNNEPRALPAFIVYDGMSDNKSLLRMGIYIAYAEVTDAVSGKKETFKKVFVVAQKLN